MGPRWGRHQEETDDNDAAGEEQLVEASSSGTERVMRRLRDALATWKAQPRSRRALTVATLLMVAIGYYHSRRRGKEGKKTNSLMLMLSSGVWKYLFKRPEHESAIEAPFSQLLQAADQGLVQRALLGGGSVVYYTLSSSSNSDGTTKWRRATMPQGQPKLHSDLVEKLSSSAQVSALGESLASRMATPVVAALPFVYLALLYRMMKNLHGGDMQLSTLSSSETSEQRTTFKDVAGIDDVVKQVYDVVAYLKDPDHYHALGAHPPRGILLYGPPGSGKTLLARAVAGEASVDGFVACSASEFVELYVGRGAARVRSLFAQVRRQARTGRQEAWWNRVLQILFRGRGASTTAVARKKTAILFIDELDALAKTRASFNSNDEREQTLNQLLTEMDGFSSSTSDQKDDDDVTLIVMAASNRADVIDPAVLRRFDRQIHVGYPDQAGREAILRIHSRRVRCSPEGTIDWNALAAISDGFSGADLRNAANEAALVAVREGAQVVAHEHLHDAIQHIHEMKVTVKRRPQSMMPTIYTAGLN